MFPAAVKCFPCKKIVSWILIHLAVAVVYRIWYSSKEIEALRRTLPLIRVIVQSGALYAAALVAVLISYHMRSKGVFVAIDVVMPLVVSLSSPHLSPYMRSHVINLFLYSGYSLLIHHPPNPLPLQRSLAFKQRPRQHRTHK